MNEKEISEIRRRFKVEKSNIGYLHGCYVNGQKEIVSIFKQSIPMMPEDEAEKVLSLLKKTLSGSIGRNLIDIEFRTEQVSDGDEQHLLMALRDSSLNDEAALSQFYDKIIQQLVIDGNFMILLAHENYDIPHRSKNDEFDNDSGDEVFSYFVCAICPIKETKPQLGFQVDENSFRNIAGDWIISAPILGFLYPAFNDRSSDIYSALYYTHDVTNNHDEFVDAIFKCNPPMPASEQKETFQSLLSNTIECSYETVQSVHEQLNDMLEEHKSSKEPEPLKFSKDTVKAVLKSAGVSEDTLSEFDEKYESQLGDIELSPVNIIEKNKLEIKTPDVTIQVNPERSDLVHTRIIDGIKYILVDATADVTVNGVNIHIQ